ncbi:hypothetical protein PU629_20025 [Pullulanibacillus sp. KACC 23026]|uniref:hypothetical protein n=1 Tax=Pullulanibacillus sp. KACC 23026 TaxID=3028315 RepID=UPI0023B0BEC7|nr:hypothetical protein [Pullulanibacillus sp. KACC 23026]WEG12357.1 hypothetical protein PU629_20025 [Pullulanibacillus sp. KACC 23026]
MPSTHLTGIMIAIFLVVFIIYRKIKKFSGWRPLPHPLIDLLMLPRTSVLFRRLAIGLFMIIVIALLTTIFSHIALITKAFQSVTPYIGHFNGLLLLWESIGVVLGFGLALLSIRSTRIERRGHVWYYRPNPYIGTIVVTLVLSRIIIKLTHLYHLYKIEKGLNFSASDLQNFDWQSQVSTSTGDTWTGLLFAMFISYFICYFILVIWKVLGLYRDQLD